MASPAAGRAGLPQDGSTLDLGVDRLPGLKPQHACRAPRYAREQPRTPQVELNQTPAALVIAPRHNGGRQHVQDTGRARPLQRHTDVAGRDPKPHRPADLALDPRQPQRATIELHLGQPKFGVVCGTAGKQHQDRKSTRLNSSHRL